MRCATVRVRRLSCAPTSGDWPSTSVVVAGCATVPGASGTKVELTAAGVNAAALFAKAAGETCRKAVGDLISVGARKRSALLDRFATEKVLAPVTAVGGGVVVVGGGVAGELTGRIDVR